MFILDFWKEILKVFHLAPDDWREIRGFGSLWEGDHDGHVMMLGCLQGVQVKLLDHGYIGIQKPKRKDHGAIFGCFHVESPFRHDPNIILFFFGHIKEVFQ
jgi:hypothetical protein